MSRFLDKWAPLAGFAYYVAGRAGHADTAPVELTIAPGGRPSRAREAELRRALREANHKLTEVGCMVTRFSRMANKIVEKSDVR